MTVQEEQIGNLGVLIPNIGFRKLARQKAHYRLKALAEANENMAWNLYFFSINRVDIENEEITGIYYDFWERKWLKKQFPYPDVLYRRGGPTKKYKENYDTFMKQCKKQETIFLNPTSFGNWKIYDYFSTVESLQQYLQETLIYEQQIDLIKMLEKYQRVYLKGCNGRKGKYVVRVEQQEEGYYEYCYYDQTSEATISERTKLSDLLTFVERFYEGKAFMVQEAIDLLEVDGRKIDLRAELQRNGDGMIQITGISARLARENSPITTHSDAITLDQLLGELSLEVNKKEALKETIHEFLYTVYEEIEKKYGVCAEMGIDFALTNDLQIKFIECNSQSTKVSLMKAYGEATFKEAFANPLLFSEYLLREREHEQRVSEPPMERPIVGTFVPKRSINRLLKQQESERMKRLSKGSEEAGTSLYFFAIQDVDFDEARIQGTYFDSEDDIWKRKWFPFPDVIYNRRSAGQTQERTQRFKAVVKEQGIPFINSEDDFDKWEFYNRLSRNHTISQYVPETKLYDPELLIDFLEQHQTIYLKANVGRYSRTVMRVKRIDTNHYQYSMVEDDLKSHEVQSVEELTQGINQYFGDKMVLMQQGVQVLSINDSMIDFRAEVQRDDHGELEVVANSVRVGAKHAPVTSTRAGASIYTFEDFFTNQYGWSDDMSQNWKQKINQFLREVYRTVEEEYGHFGEMGIDFAIDQEERLWLIECNTKSAKVALMESYDEERIDKAFTNPLRFAKYLYQQQRVTLS
ncbi:YheC/YheD family endospore coat-associated protein [Desertibacillus haloalkaliphilus]|uniref:YheC/YheD family endospore coat-associated protein n=1 Tax=Desertibacillus haloalkaliphilus TaxID=1328930 RepID=UPI001C2767A6|nr:YheC/YheD family protein [Desertibacillus haloalkaliphilus]MBU8907596.1 YheC/YheD family protein [Desertibacillus haloalkaliphilus]